MEENVKNILSELDFALGKITDDDFQDAANLINNAHKIFVLGLGRAGFAIKSLGMRLMHMGKDAYAFGETITPDFESGDLLIVASGSGKTAQLVGMAQKAEKLGGKVLAVTTNDQSPLYDLADKSIIIDAPSKVVSESKFHSVQPMASLYEQGILIFGDALVLYLMKHSKETGDQLFKRHSNLE